MTISNYTELKTAVGDWLHHGGLTGKDADFIQIAEARINRELRLREMEIEVDLSLTASSRVAALPAGFQEPLGVYLTRSNGSYREPLTKYAPEMLPVTSDEGEPDGWCVDGDEIAFNRPLDVDTYTVTLRYLKGWDIATDATNWLLTNHPDVYLWGSLMEGTLYLRDEQRYGLYESKYLKAAKPLQNQSRRNRKANLKSEVPTSRASFNITRGY